MSPRLLSLLANLPQDQAKQIQNEVYAFADERVGHAERNLRYANRIIRRLIKAFPNGITHPDVKEAIAEARAFLGPH